MSARLFGGFTVRFRGVLAVVCGMVTLGIPTSALAKYGFCKTHAPHQSVRVTPVFEYPARVGSDGIDPDFESYIEAKLGFNVYPSCLFYDDEDHAKKMQAYTLAETAQDLPAILDNGFENYLAQKYGGGRKTKPAPTPVADGAAQSDTSKAVTPAGPTQSEIAAEKHRAVEEHNRAAQAQYEADLSEQQRKVAEFKRLTEEMERKKAEQQAAAQQAIDSHARDMAAHAQQVRQADAANLEYRKQVAKPAGASNAMYRGFVGRDCAAARLSATNGAGTDSGTHFVEVESEMIGGNCTVRGWQWSTQKGGSSRQ